MEVQLKGGILIIGSLIWDPSPIRVKWREEFLDNIDNIIDVPAPIRYGRISRKRNCTYTMVFSHDCLSPGKLGIAKFIGFKNNPLTLDDILLQSKELIKAETDQTEVRFKTFNWKWGALGLCINPNKEKGKNEEIKYLKVRWAENYGKQKPLIPSDFVVGEEEEIISETGILDIPWSDNLNEFDFFISTIVKPEIKEYPNAYKIAEKMIVNESDEYFMKNKSYSIKTFQDDEIILELEKFKASR